MKHKLSLTLGIILLLIICLATSPAKAASPTMKSILDAIITLQNSVNNMPPAWYQILPSHQRFLLVMGHEAVLDRETGLVWERSPSTNNDLMWVFAQEYCNNLISGNRKGWRLPTIQELASLVDPTKSNPALPTGHPFSNVQSVFYWSATSALIDSSYAWGVNFGHYGDLGSNGQSSVNSVWCVRGGQGVDPQ